MNIIIQSLFLLFVVSSCMSGQRAQTLDIESTAIEHSIQEAHSDPLFATNMSLPYDWWELFQDSQLTGFIETVFAKNPTLQIAQTNTLAAATLVSQARAALYPSLFYGADVVREKLSETGIIPFNSQTATSSPQLPSGAGVPNVAPGGHNGIPVYFTQYETEASLSYEFDFWGKNLNTMRAAIGKVHANIAEEAVLRLQLSIAVAKIYFKLQINYKRLDLIKELVKNKTKAVSILNQRFHNNLEDIQSLYTTDLDLAEANQNLLQIQNEISIGEYQLKAYLGGNFDQEIDKTTILGQHLPKIALPEELPLHLIAQRPDITAQLWLIESAGKQVQVAKAGFYPDFNLAALFGFQTIHLHELFKWPSTYFNINPALSLPIFDGGRLTANLRNSEVNYDKAIYEYNQLIIDAVKDAITAITELRNFSAQFIEIDKIANYRKELLHLSTLRLNNGLNTSLQDVDANQSHLESENLKLVAWGSVLDSFLKLVKALGGGYGNYEEHKG